MPWVSQCIWDLKELVDVDSSVGGEAVKQNISSPETTDSESGEDGLTADWLADEPGHLHPPFGRILLGTGPGLAGREASVLWLDRRLGQRGLQAAVSGRRWVRSAWNTTQTVSPRAVMSWWFSRDDAPITPAVPGLTRLTGFWTGLWRAGWPWFWFRPLGAGRGGVSWGG